MWPRYIIYMYNVSESSILCFTFRWGWWTRRDNEAKTYQIFAEIKIKIWNWYQYKSRQDGRTRHGTAARPFPPRKTLSLPPPLRHFRIYTRHRCRTFYDSINFIQPLNPPVVLFTFADVTTRGGGDGMTDRQDPSLFGWVYFLFL